MYAFDYARPRTIQEVQELLANDVEPRLLAGGQTLLPSMKHRLTAHSTLIDLQDVEGLRELRDDGDTVLIGAMVCHAEVAASGVIRERIPALAVLAGGIADPSVRNMGTIGGSLANSDPAADYPGALAGLGGVVITDRRTIEADGFFTGMFQTALEPGEIIVAVRFPVPTRAGYCKLPNRASGYVLAGAFVSENRGEMRVAINGVGQHAFRLPGAEVALAKSFHPLAADLCKPELSQLVDDPAAPANFKRELVAAAVNRAIQRALNPPFQ